MSFIVAAFIKQPCLVYGQAIGFVFELFPGTSLTYHYCQRFPQTPLGGG